MIILNHREEKQPSVPVTRKKVVHIISIQPKYNSSGTNSCNICNRVCYSVKSIEEYVSMYYCRYHASKQYIHTLYTTHYIIPSTHSIEHNTSYTQYTLYTTQYILTVISSSVRLYHTAYRNIYPAQAPGARKDGHHQRQSCCIECVQVYGYICM